MTARVRKRATYDDLVHLPENMVGEIIDGELYAWPRPRGVHGDASSGFVSRLGLRNPFVDPDARTVEVMQLNGTHDSVLNVFTGDGKFSADPFPAATIDLAVFWGSTSD